jgi:hypothetical protein
MRDVSLAILVHRFRICMCIAFIWGTSKGTVWMLMSVTYGSLPLYTEANVSKLGGSTIIGNKFTICTYDQVYDRRPLRSGGRRRKA